MIQSYKKSTFTLLKDYLASVNAGNHEEAASFFAENGCIEAPYFESLGMPTRIEGKLAIDAAIKRFLQKTPSFHYTKIKLILESPTEVVAECESEAILSNGEFYRQLYINHLITKDGKIVCHREFFDTISFARAHSLNIKADLK